MNSICFSKEAPVRYHAEVAVIGGGVAGCAAAIAAARHGVDTLLIEQTGMLGGMATLGHVSPLDARTTQRGEHFGGLIDEIVTHVEDMNRRYGRADHSLRNGPEFLRLVLLQMVRESGARILFHASLAGVERRENRIVHAFLHTKSGIEALEAQCWIDASGDGDLVAEALSSVRIPGRIEQIRTSPTIILDGGHNVNAAESLRAAIEENYDFQQLVGVVAMMGDKQVEEYLGVLEPLLSQVIVTENSWRDRVMPAEDLKKIADRVFGPERVTCIPELPDAIQEAVNMVDADDELGVGYGHGVLICGSFTTAGDARLMLEEKVNPDLKKPKPERVFQEAVEPEPRKDEDEADVDFESDTNPDFDINDFGSVGPDEETLKDAAESDTTDDSHGAAK